MKRKFGTIVEEDLIFRAKQMALEDKKPLNMIIEEALKTYFDSRLKGHITQSTRGVLKINKAALKEIMREEGWYEA
jgi:hypothetical protein